MEILDSFFSIVNWFIAQGFNAGQITIIILGTFFYFKAFSPLLKKVNEIKNNFDDLHNATREIQVYLKNKKGGLANPVHGLEKLSWANSNSPFVLNPRGQWLSEKSGIAEVVRNNSEVLVKILENNNPLNGYDVESLAIKEVANYVEANVDIIQKIKDFIYKNPVHESKEIGLNDIYFVGSIVLRDLYLEKHPEIKID